MGAPGAWVTTERLLKATPRSPPPPPCCTTSILPSAPAAVVVTQSCSHQRDSVVETVMDLGAWGQGDPLSGTQRCSQEALQS